MPDGVDDRLPVPPYRRWRRVVVGVVVVLAVAASLLVANFVSGGRNPDQPPRRPAMTG